MNATDGEIQRAQIEATKASALARAGRGRRNALS
jgi:hypothetical protein